MVPAVALPVAWGPAITAFVQVVLIDVTLAGDNAVAVGMAVAGLPKGMKRRAIFLGLATAALMLMGFALIAVQHLGDRRGGQAGQSDG